MTQAWLLSAADRFWQMVGTPLPFPRDLETVISLGLPLWHESLPNLSVRTIETWFGARDVPYQFVCHNRSLCGCIVAGRGHGILFSCSDDSPAERRFTIAHEVAHFLLDYLQPRARALESLGPAILPVLNGERPPTRDEAIDALLGRTPLGVYVDMMPRSATGSIDRGYVLRAEDRADLLAVELLAPAEIAVPVIDAIRTSDPHDRRQTVEALIHDFGLPHEVADRYAAVLLRGRARQSAREWLGI